MIPALAELPLPYPFEREYMQLALMAGVLVGGCAPLIGAFLVQKRLSLMGDGIGHVAFAGVAAGLLWGVWPIATALVAAIGGAVAVEYIRSRRRESGDLALALLFYSGIAGGVVIASKAQSSLSGDLFSYLFGSILVVSPSDAWTVAGLGVGILAVIVVFWRALFAVVVDEESARVAGLPVDRLNLAMAALAALTVVAAMRVVGVLLVAALMVLPVGAAQRLAGSFRTTLVLSGLLGATSALVGLALARVFSTAPGGTIVLVAAGSYIGAMAWTAGRRLFQGRAVSI